MILTLSDRSRSGFRDILTSGTRALKVSEKLSKKISKMSYHIRVELATIEDHSYFLNQDCMIGQLIEEPIRPSVKKPKQ